jgi:hypothetical protein
MKRTREEYDAYVEVIRKCARVLGDIKDSKDAMLLRPQLQWLERDFERDALEAAQTPETLKSRLHSMFYEDLTLDVDKHHMLWNVVVKRNWPDMGSDVPPYLSLEAEYHGRETRDWSGAVFFQRDLTPLANLPSLDGTFYRVWGEIIEKHKKDRNDVLNQPDTIKYEKMEQELFDIFSWLVHSKKLSVYSSNNAILSLFKYD